MSRTVDDTSLAGQPYFRWEGREGEKNTSGSRVQTPPDRGEKKGSGYNTTSRPGLGGRNQHTIVSYYVLTYAIYGIL